MNAGVYRSRVPGRGDEGKGMCLAEVEEELQDGLPCKLDAVRNPVAEEEARNEMVCRARLPAVGPQLKRVHAAAPPESVQGPDVHEEVVVVVGV